MILLSLFFSMQRYQLPLSEIYTKLTSSADGLTAHQAQARLQEVGPNHIQTMTGTSALTKFFGQFKDWMIILLIVSAALSFYLGDFRTGAVLSIIVLFNAVIGFIQEYKAERVMESLKSLVHPAAKVLRDGSVVEVPVQDVVPGDIVILEEGDSVPADVRIMLEDDIATNDFALTGESNPVKKTTDPIRREVPLGERANLAFMGTTVARGRGRGIVIATGTDTILGQIASLSNETEGDLSPLQQEINNISLKLTIGTIVVGAILFFIALLVHLSLQEAFLFALGIAMSLVPQGMPAQISVALSLASSRLSHQNVVVKKLSSVETLGSTTIICTDKTGTLTQNQMTVEHVVLGTDVYNVSGVGYKPQGKIVDHNGLSLDHTTLKQRKYFFRTGILASTARLNQPDENHRQRYVLGDPTEGALITLAAKAGYDQSTLEENHTLLKLYPFDSERKRMSCVRDVDGSQILFVKGASDAIISRCTHIVDGGEERSITDADKKKLLNQNDERASNARRQLIFAYKKIDPNTDRRSLDDEQIEDGLVLLGMVSMIDPPRPEVHDAMEAAYRAHINVAIITGDHALTATAIARQVGLDADGREIVTITGTELTNMTDSDIVAACMAHHIIFSRTAPQDKLRIVSALKNAGAVVAVTGDGINDAPALKKADIGVAMGITGTDVSKDASDLILLQDNFSDLVTAIRE
ncbi:MAG: HAD-IC family P-type ATPase [Candidatus Peribacteria bacterium]|nr:MAG: HAD-IC family P-type ATPase [Candidatus Peribacteria bacterium]